MPEYVGFTTTITIIVLIIIGLWVFSKYWKNIITIREIQETSQKLKFTFYQKTQRRSRRFSQHSYQHWNMTGLYKNHKIRVYSFEKDEIPLTHKLLLHFQTATYLFTAIRVYHNYPTNTLYQLSKETMTKKIASWLGIQDEDFKIGDKNFDKRISIEADTEEEKNASSKIMRGIPILQNSNFRSEILKIFDYDSSLIITNKFIDYCERGIIKTENYYRKHLEKLCNFSDTLDTYTKS